MKKQSPWIEIPEVRTFEHLRAAVNGYTYSRVILTALDLDIFSVIGEKLWTIRRLARTMDASERGVGILCRNLASLGLLDVQHGQYKNSPLSATARVGNRPASLRRTARRMLRPAVRRPQPFARRHAGRRPRARARRPPHDASTQAGN